jgi:apolipoprotein N-acyltransferase
MIAARTRPGLSAGVLPAGMLLLAFSMGSWLFPLAAWIGPALILRYSRDRRGGRWYVLLLAALVVAFFIGFGRIWAQWGALSVVIYSLLYGLLWSLPYVSDRVLSSQLRGFSSTLVFPLAMTSLEFLNNYINPLGAWGATGFTQYGILPLMQVASVTGMIGITFLIGWSASTANWFWENRTRFSEIRRGLVVFGSVFALVFFFGFLRLTLAPVTETVETVRVAGITTESQDSLAERTTGLDREGFQREVEAHWQAYFDATAREAQAGAQVVVWPELAGQALASEEASMTERAQEVARQNGVYLALPFITGDWDTKEAMENKLLLIDPSGEVVIEHIKYGGAIIESTRVGDGTIQAVDTPFGVLSGVICYDMDYPEVIQQTGQNGTGLILVPSKDWLEIDPIHSHMAAFRGIENGMSMVRQTDLGLSIATDPYGRTLAEVDFFGATDRTMVAQVPTEHVATVYNLFGRWFEWVCSFAFLTVVAFAIVKRRSVADK